jgi:hypothetical protein
MQNIDLNFYLIKNITEYLYTHEQVCFKFVNKSIYEAFNLLSLKIKEPSFNYNFSLKILYWLIDNLKLSKKFQVSCCNKLCVKKDFCKLYECLDNKNFDYSPSFLRLCLVYEVDDIILNCIMSKKQMYDLSTIYLAAVMNNKRVLKWCFRNKKLCTSQDIFDDTMYDLIEYACKTKYDNLTTVRYLFKNNFKVNKECLKNCIKHGNFYIFRYILDKIKYDLSINFTPSELMNISIEYNRLNFMKHLKEIYGLKPRDITFIYNLVNQYNQTNDKNILDCIEWLLDNGKYILQEDIEKQLFHIGFNV